MDWRPFIVSLHAQEFVPPNLDVICAFGTELLPIGLVYRRARFGGSGRFGDVWDYGKIRAVITQYLRSNDPNCLFILSATLQPDSINDAV